tara:strand:+ start:264 stop:569 length:306 start_codon:yes stop_codon:yes gene_type:complete
MKKTVRSVTIQIQKVFARVGQPVTTDIKVDLITDIPGYEQVVETHSNLVDTDAIIAEAIAALPEKLSRDGYFEVEVSPEPEAAPVPEAPPEPPSAAELAGD